MKNNNVFKPRYKIAFQVKSKVWPYKNSRMRRFFNIRGRKLIRRGYFKRYVLVFNNMKWAIARRYVKPYIKRRHPSRIRKRYKMYFYTKQQLRHFYGKIKESSFRVFFRNSLISIVRRNNSFFSLLERRLDMIVFRMRFLPTIFASNQMIQHYGVCVNKQIERSANTIVRVGDVITLPKTHWSPIYFNMFTRLFFKVYGKYILKRRMFKNIRKKVWWLKKAKRFKRRYISWVRKKSRFLKYFKHIRMNFEYFYRRIMLQISNYHMHYKKKKLEKIFQHFPLFEKLYNEKSDFKIEEIFKKFKEVFVKSIKKVKTWIKKRKILIYKWRWKKTYTNLLKILALCLNITSILNHFWMRFRLEEMNIYSQIILKGIYKKFLFQAKDDFFDLAYSWNFVNAGKRFKLVRKILNERKALIIQQSAYLQKNLTKYYFYILKKKLKKLRPNLQWRRQYLSYFLTKRKRKKKNKLRTPRLKVYHWFLPKYIYFDFQYMSGMLIASPVSKDIQYSFRCSLSKIYSFYKSRGY